jgi:hypothetical protein
MFFFRYCQGGRGGQGYSQRIFRSAPVALKRVERLRHSEQRALSAPSIVTPLIKRQSPVRSPELQRSWLYFLPPSLGLGAPLRPTLLFPMPVPQNRLYLLRRKAHSLQKHPQVIQQIGDLSR